MEELTIIKAGLLSGIGRFITDQSLSAIGALMVLGIGIIAKKYLVPLLKTAQAKQTAGHVLIIADDVTDYFAEKFPSAHWSVWLDRAIDKIIEVTGVNRGPAERAVRASISRKKSRLVIGEEKIKGRG